MRQRLGNGCGGLLRNGLLALSVSLIVAYFLASFASHRVAPPLTTIRNAVDRIGSGDYSKPFSCTRKTNFGQVAEALNKMTIGLQRREDLKSGWARYVSEDILNGSSTPVSLPVYSRRKKVTTLSPMCGDSHIFPDS